LQLHAGPLGPLFLDPPAHHDLVATPLRRDDLDHRLDRVDQDLLPDGRALDVGRLLVALLVDDGDAEVVQPVALGVEVEGPLLGGGSERWMSVGSWWPFLSITPMLKYYS